MNMAPVQSKSSPNGIQHRRSEREGLPNKTQPTKSHPAHTPNMDSAFNGETGSLERPLRDRLVYLATCKIGQLVEVHLKNGSVYSGIFHAADVEKDFGIILKMACLIKEGTLRGYKSRSEFVRKPPSKTFIIPADELVQVVAKDLSVSKDGMLNTVRSDKSLELLTDSSISKSSQTNLGRELEPWVPDDNVTEHSDLANVFDDTWKRGWNQFEVNETLFGVKSTFNEELYTTKLERGPRTRELEEHALRIAREIEGENTRDLHLAEERGHQLDEKFDIDEESKYSSVRPVDGFDDSGFNEEDDIVTDTCNDLTFGGSSTSGGQKPASSSSKGYEELWDGRQSSQNDSTVDQSSSISDDNAQHLLSEQRSIELTHTGSSSLHNSGSQLGERRNNNNPEVSHNNRSAEESVSGDGDMKEGARSGGGERERQVTGNTTSESSIGQQAACRGSESRPAPSTSTSTSSRPGVSPSSSMGSLSSSEKSTLNPNAKEFKPSRPAAAAAARPQAQIPEGSFYYPGPVQQMPGMPPVGGYGVQQYHPGQQAMVYPQAYFPPNGPPHQYPHQQMMVGQPRPVVFIPPPPHPYQPEMPPYNKGRD